MHGHAPEPTLLALFRPRPGLYHGAMRIVCPACIAAYEIPADRLVPGRVVRCARCGTDWTPVPPEPDPSPVPETVPEPPSPPPSPPPDLAPESAPFDARAGSQPQARRRFSALGLAWALSITILLACAWAAYAGRNGIMQAWPPSARAYATLGLAGSH